MQNLNEEFWIKVSDFLNANPAIVFKMTTHDTNAIKQRGITWSNNWEILQKNSAFIYDICRIIKDLQYLKESNAYISMEAFEYLKVIDNGLKNLKTNPDIKVVGGDNTNCWYFYSNDTNTLDVAMWAKNNLSGMFADMPLGEILTKHIYFGSDTGFSKAVYNGDTIVLYKNIDDLEENQKTDAEADR